jgi:deoxyribodipyrimidine photo-lyase
LTTTRLHPQNDQPIRSDREFVLYWMTSARRLRSNYALQRAVQHAATLGTPLVILEALRCGYPHASDRLHRFVLDGMREHAAALAGSPVLYYPYVEPSVGAGKGLLAALAAHATVVVTDWYPAFFLPRMIAAAGSQVDCALEAVDTNGLLPVALAGRAIPMAHGFRAHLQRSLREQLRHWPEEDPLARLPDVQAARLDVTITTRWPAATDAMSRDARLADLPIDHAVQPVAIRGGTAAARARLDEFVDQKLTHYAKGHNQPEQDFTSRLSPWLHFGHLSAHEVFERVMSREKWTSRQLGTAARGAREGWWNTSASTETFLDELITWRELAFNTAAFVPDFDRYDTLPGWARQTLEAHRGDRRTHVYALEEFENAATHDALWNAAQRQLVRDGWFHGYMRMLWGKKILEWTRRPEDALAVMAHLMNKYSLDGRDPNSWAGFAWVLGRYDRPWPEREIFGAVRYMSSTNTAKKLRVKNYLETYGETTAASSTLFLEPGQ